MPNREVRVLPQSEAVIRVFVVDADPHGANLREVLRTTPGLDIVGEGPPASTTIEEVAGLAPHVALVRVDDHDQGVTLCREIRSRHDDVSCLVVSSLGEDEAMLDAILGGAVGVLRDDTDPHDLGARVRAAYSGRSDVREWLERNAAAPATGGVDPLERLTYRERTVVRYIVRGLTNREIGEHLGLAEKTVRNYVSNILNKLDLDNRTQLAVHLARLAASNS